MDARDSQDIYHVNCQGWDYMNDSVHMDIQGSYA